MGKHKCKKIEKNKHVIRLVNNKEISSHSRYLLRLGKILNVHQLNVLNFTTFIHRVQSKAIPRLSLSKFHKPQHTTQMNVCYYTFDQFG